MRACASCAAPNEPARRYCGKCAASLIWSCARCTFPNAAADRFCGGCAAPSNAASSTTTPTTTTTNNNNTNAASTRVTLSELESLIATKPEARAVTEALPANVTQEALDRLFGANG